MEAAGGELPRQETESAIMKLLAAQLKHKTFIDVGAEKGSFAAWFLGQGFEGTLFEPLAEHLPVLQKLVEGNGSRVFPFAIDATDHEGSHRSLGSLTEEGVLAPEVGLLKINTKGSDLKVIEGMGSVRAEVLMCEFMTPSLHPDWESSFPERLTAAVKALGYEHCIAVSRFDEHEVVEMDPLHYVDGQWGNLIFTSAEILHAARTELHELLQLVHRRHVEACQKAHQTLVEKETKIQEQAAVCLDQQRRLDERRVKIAELRQKISALKEKNERLRAHR
jgi:hypothetical protein